jgi:hypothetical protein
MAKKVTTPRVREVAETFFGKQLSADPGKARHHQSLVQQLREAARGEVEASERSERLTKEDLSVVINARADQITLQDE